MAIYISGGSGGSSTLSSQVLTASGSVSAWGTLVLVDTTTGNITVTLPSALGASKGQNVVIKKISNDNNIVIVKGYNTNTIESSAQSLYLYGNGDAITLCNMDGDSKIISDNRNSTSSSASYLFATMTAPQTPISPATTFAVGDSVIFNLAKTQIGNKISLNTTNGIVTVKANSIYSIKGSLQAPSANGVSACGVSLQTSTDGITWTTINSAEQVSASQAWNDSDPSPVLSIPINPTVDTYVRCIISRASYIIALGNGGALTSALPWLEVQEVSRQATTIQTFDYCYGNVTSTQVPSGADVIVPISSISGNLTVSNNMINLGVGKTYLVMFSCRVTNANYNIAINPYLYNVTTSATIANTSLAPTTWTQNNDMPNNNMIYVVTTTANTQLQLKASNVNGGTPSISGTFFVQQFGSTATSSVPSNLVDNQYIPFTPTITAVTTNPTLGTSADLKACYMVIGKTLKIQFNLYNPSAGTFGSGNYKINISSIPYSMDTSKIRISTNGYDASSLGHALLSLGASNGESGKVVAVSGTELGIYCTMPWNTNTPLGFWSSSNHAMGAGICLSFNCEIPIQ